MLEINDMTQAFFEARFTDSWGRDYLTGRFGIDLAAGDERFRPGRRRRVGPTWSTTCAAAASAIPR